MNNWKSNPFIKGILVLLLCLSGALVMWCGFGAMYYNNELFGKEVSFMDSQRTEWISRNHAYQIVDGYFEETLDDQNDYLRKRTNVDYALYIYDAAGSDYRMMNWTGLTHAWKKEYYFLRTPEHIELMNEEPYLTQKIVDQTGGTYGRIILYVDEALTKADSYAEEYQMFERLGRYRNLYLPVGIVSVIVFIIALIKAFQSAGHSRRSEELKLYWIDRINFEFLLVCLGVVLFIHMLLGKEFVGGNIGDEFLRMVFAVLIAMSASLFIFVVLMSLARRIKTKTFSSTSVLGMFWWLLKEVPLKIQVFGVCALYMIFRVVSVHEPFLVLMTDLILIVILLLMFVNGHQLLIAGERLAAGDLDYRISEDQLHHMHWFFRTHGEHLGQIAEGMQIAVEKEMKSERLKTELITNVSHDIKTPLTSIINYVDLLQKEHTEEQEKEYLDVLERNSSRLKKLTEDLVEASKASTGNLPVNLEETDVGELVEQSLAEFDDRLKEAELTPVVSIPEGMTVMADGRLLWRILDNLLANCVKYAMPHTRIYIDAYRQNGKTVLAVKNVSREPLNISADELMERFVRGDASRSTEGSGLGLNIARSLALLQKGDLKITIDGDYFKAETELPSA
ncbi:MAG: HAMP domain-containing histidine kinase [Solobacterium sp.]|nr:HAMP domain-containing histidine kinase [Solobacterium sp.]